MARFNSEAGEAFMRCEKRCARGVASDRLQRVKRGELEAVHVTRGKQKGLRIKVIARQPGLFDPTS
jgi:hypothetical protein